MVESRTIESANAIASQQIPIRDDCRNRTSMTDVSNDPLEIRVEQGFATAQRDDARAELCESVDTPQHVWRGDWRRVIVVLVAVRARQIAPANRNQMSGNGLISGPERPDQHSHFTHTACGFSDALSHPHTGWRFLPIISRFR
jgi:hypothetical protein